MSISKKIWVVDTLSDFMAGFDTGAPPLEDAWEYASLVIPIGPVQDEPARVPSVGAQGKEPIIKPVCALGPSGSSLEVIPEDGHKRVLLRVNTAP